MMVKEHYDTHLAAVYSWMAGDFRTKADEFRTFLKTNAITPSANKLAIDLGAGHGIQSIALAESGFTVVAVDFNDPLLNELRANARDLDISITNDDIRNINRFAHRKPALIACCGDTLSHLDSKAEIKSFIANIAATLDNEGTLILSFRDYTHALTGPARFIPVKSDDTRILTCILEYEDDHVYVTDQLYEKYHEGWKQKVSTYTKVRVRTPEIEEYIRAAGMTIAVNEVINRITTIVAIKKSPS
jgi:ubiquinone/menaquinone biosynthesis C-methylase UbiE